MILDIGASQEKYEGATISCDPIQIEDKDTIQIPHALGTFTGLFHEYEQLGVSSFFKPNRVVIEEFIEKHNKWEWNIKKSYKVRVETLDDAMKRIGKIDKIKLDVQGAELNILKSGEETLKDVKEIELEVHWIEVYIGQPLFSEVNEWLMNKGFQFKDFKRIKVIKGQLCWADVLYVKPHNDIS